MSTYNLHTKYNNYTAEDLLKDESFINHSLYPDEKSEKYWKKLLDEDILNRQEYELACFYIDSVQVQEEMIEDEEIIDLWGNIEVANKRNLKAKRKLFYIISSVAAGILCLTILSISRFFQSSDLTTLAMTKIEDVKAPDMDVTDIRLILSDEEAISFEEKEVKIAYNQEGIEINEKETALKNQRNEITDTPVFNQLIVPKGKRSTLTFNDGSKIWVNAGSRVVYPAKFETDQREIYIDGEAYLEVVPDAARPFIVKSKTIQIEVLGTSFNVTAYEADSTQSVVSVNGSVKVNAGSFGEHLLSPSEMLACSANGPEIKKVNTADFVSWKTGVYQFRSEPLGNILKRLSRYYGKDIVFTSAISDFKCSGKLDLRDELEEVMKNISGTAPVKYELSGDTYIVSNL